MRGCRTVRGNFTGTCICVSCWCFSCCVCCARHAIFEVCIFCRHTSLLRRNNNQRNAFDILVCGLLAILCAQYIRFIRARVHYTAGHFVGRCLPRMPLRCLLPAGFTVAICLFNNSWCYLVCGCKCNGNRARRAHVFRIGGAAADITQGWRRQVGPQAISVLHHTPSGSHRAILIPQTT